MLHGHGFGGLSGRPICRSGCRLIGDKCHCSFVGNRYSNVLRGYGFGEGEAPAVVVEEPITVEQPMIAPSGGGISDFFASLPPWAPWAAIAVVALMRR